MNTDPWFVLDEDGYPTGELKLDRLAQVREAELPDQRDLDAALTLLDATGDWAESWCEDSEKSRYITENALRTLQIICHRLGVQADLTSKLDVSGGRRREYEVWDMLRPVHEELLALERDLLARELEGSGWPGVEREVESLRMAWRNATAEPENSSIGNHAVRVLETLSDVVGFDDIPRDRTKTRITAYLDKCAGGGVNGDIKKLVVHAIDLAHGVKHARTPTRGKTGAAATAAIMVVSIVRLASEV